MKALGITCKNLLMKNALKRAVAKADTTAPVSDEPSFADGPLSCAELILFPPSEAVFVLSGGYTMAYNHAIYVIVIVA